MKYIVSLLCFWIASFLFSGCNTSSKNESIVLDNEIISKQFTFSEVNADKIGVSCFFKNNQGNSLNQNELPFFEFVIDNQLISSNDKLWIFRKHNQREMLNKGTEHQLIFEGVKSPVDGLQIVLWQQVFPNSTLVREKLELKSEGKSFVLNKMDGKLRFRFPNYSVRNDLNEPVQATEIRIATWEKKPITFGNHKKGNHMYYPEISSFEVDEKKSSLKGPFSIITNGDISWLTAYEHASQDNLNGMLKEEKTNDANQINDAMQGTKGVFNFPIKEADFKFIGISNQIVGKYLNISVEMLRGAYFDGEEITKEHSYSTVWTATGFYTGSNLDEGKNMIHHYLLDQICERPASRKQEFYYNTWGLQREDPKKSLRGILTYERIYREIDYAAEMGMDIFVLDDGWNNKHGEWFAHKERLSEGLAPIKKHLDKYEMKLGLWFSPMGIDSTSQRYKDHPEWIIKDSENKPIIAQWGHPAFDFVSGFSDLFIEDCKSVIDQGCRFMKWDAINTFFSCLPNLEHGSDKYSEQEIRARYEYLLPIYVVRAMEILTDYEPELVIELDLTEARRVMVGLAPFSQGKMFWMNNGASSYNDYSSFRAKSMRTIPNEYAGIIPLELFTYSNYPQNMAQRMQYNVTNSILAGHGFWGNLELMNKTERLKIGEQIKLSRDIAPYIVNLIPKVSGEVGDSPEIYELVNKEKAAGQLFLFSEKPFKKIFKIVVDTYKLLAVLNHPYTTSKNQVEINFKSQNEESSSVAYFIPNQDSGVSISNSTSDISKVSFDSGELSYTSLGSGKQIIKWSHTYGKPRIKNGDAILNKIEQKDDYYLIEVIVNSHSVITIGKEN